MAGIMPGLYFAQSALQQLLLAVCLYLTASTGAGLFLLPGVLWLAWGSRKACSIDKKYQM